MIWTLRSHGAKYELISEWFEKEKENFQKNNEVMSALYQKWCPQNHHTVPIYIQDAILG